MSDLPPPTPPSPSDEPPPVPSQHIPAPASEASPPPTPAPDAFKGIADAIFKDGASDDPKPKDESEKTMGTVMHLLQYSGLVLAKVPFAGIVAPLVLWLIKREQSPYLDAAGKEVMNFQINLSIVVLIGMVLCLVPGIIAAVAGLILIGIAAYKTHQTGFYRYPWIYRFIK